MGEKSCRRLSRNFGENITFTHVIATGSCFQNIKLGNFYSFLYLCEKIFQGHFNVSLSIGLVEIIGKMSSVLLRESKVSVLHSINYNLLIMHSHKCHMNGMV